LRFLALIAPVEAATDSSTGPDSSRGASLANGKGRG